MKVTIIEDEDVEAFMDEANEDDPFKPTPPEGASFREATKAVQEICIPRSVVNKFQAQGLTVDHVVAMLVKQMGKSQ